MGDMMIYRLLHGDNREQLRHLADNSIDSIVCDPPYELGFMGKRWDSTGIAYDRTVWTECLRVLKPGGHLIAFGGTRTYHRMTVAIEDAGFEIRDCIMYLYGSGFPKSHNLHGDWHGYGTALKPAVEPAVLARKPLIGTVADNVTTWGVGAINIDGCRVGTEGGGTHCSNRDEFGKCRGHKNAGRSTSGETFHAEESAHPSGRWPANVILDEDAGEALDAQSGWSQTKPQTQYKKAIKSVAKGHENDRISYVPYSDSGGASRFFYTAKASKAEREAGLEGMEVKPAGGMQGNVSGGRLAGDGRESPEIKPVHRANHHPTVKPIALMRYLVRLVTPKGGTVLDPFMGSGSTGCAAMCEGMDFVGIELSEEYLEIARRRIEYWQSQNPMGL
jgi:site-specific DNA-methyltransferase (adenine-specific)